MRTWTAGTLAALALATSACGSSKKATCEKVLNRAMECSEKLKGLPDDMESSARGFADDMIESVCKTDEGQAGADMLSKCLDEDGCDAFNPCMEKASAGLVELK